MGATLWIAETGSGGIGGCLGDTHRVARLFRWARADGLLDRASWVNLPGRGGDIVPDGFEIQEEWA